MTANTIYFLIQFFKRVFCIPSGTCRHIPSCSHFVKAAIIELPFHEAVVRILSRLLRCHPFGTSGYDPVIKEKNN
ncbi:MAG: membrane protein insertion efficiency factor YidD [Chitinispirillales bacterium]|nr:membrane protein insertion efficiency factor YidD [Chitinispirillales bacterium]